MPIRLATLYCALVLFLTACGGGGGGGGSSPAPQPPLPSGPNVQTITIDQGPSPGSFVTANVPYISVTICPPGGSSCQSIDHILVDTGSSGLRILASVLNVALPQQTNGSGAPIGTCAKFASSYSWGAVRTADLKISGEVASSLPIQVIGDSSVPSVPSACSSSGSAMNSQSALGANGIIGIGAFRQDCGSNCASSTSPGLYYACAGGTNCTAVTQPLALQITNPVTLFANDNNGSLIQLPGVGANGAATVNGSLIFGIGTRTNNSQGSATAYPLDPSSGTLSTSYKGTTYGGSFIDSGSNALFFNDSTIPVCASNSVAADFSCPGSTQSLSATIQGFNGQGTGAVGFSIANAVGLFQSHSSYAAFSNLGGPGISPTAFDWGLPFFYGRSVFTAIEGGSTPSGNGPYIAF